MHFKEFRREPGQIEYKGNTKNDTAIYVIIGRDGWTHKKRERRGGVRQYPDWAQDTSPYTMRMSMNGPAFLTEYDLEDIWRLFKTAREELDRQIKTW